MCHNLYSVKYIMFSQICWQILDFNFLLRLSILLIVKFNYSRWQWDRCPMCIEPKQAGRDGWSMQIWCVFIMHTGDWPDLFKNCLDQRNLKSEKGSGVKHRCMCFVSTNKNTAVLVLGTESKFWILTHIHCLDMEKCNSKQKLTQEGEKNKMWCFGPSEFV